MISFQDCETGTAKCTNIRCTIKFLKAGDEVTIRVISRLWNGTMIEVSALNQKLYQTPQERQLSYLPLSRHDVL
mgnify:CR=1 FL=1